ncbi:thiamine biosynthesis protein [Mucilaginibacter terrenus]|uniref:Molybdopterin-synthase adenylyltransferase n=1 Tax=Mucilaginibacter terrenus TaxID=2482727 RepID=A0A3E2NVF6_9SPHI|nr:ThiF family adenylyltransferase [Mucilaginibacter terrenus]RFZ84988.1 thiamine biosynthesis protein [Mucilaginibacter terrenus]
MDKDLLRYSCQMALPGFGESTQRLLQAARVLIVGAGGLGCPAAQYLAASGVGTIGIADYDVVSVSNLHRQILYDPDDAGKNKAIIACERLLRQNPEIQLVPHVDKITSANVLQIIDGYDVIVDCTDNFDTRYLLNDAGVLSNKPVVYGAIYQYEGQVAVWNVVNHDGARSPNYRDLFPKVDASQIPNCSVAGVIPTLAGIIGCIQANEVIKYITGSLGVLTGKVLVFDVLSMQSRIVKIGATTKTSITELAQTVDVQTISPLALKRSIAEVQLIDVRTYQERDLEDIGGEHIPLDELEQNLDKLSTGKKVVFYCATGKRSAEAVKIVKDKMQAVDAFSLQDGLAGWSGLEEH